MGIIREDFKKMIIKSKVWIMNDETEKISRLSSEFDTLYQFIEYIEDLRNNVRILEISAVFDYTEA